MQPAIETREVIAFEADGTWLRGTCHKPRDDEGASPPAPKRIGLLFLSGGLVPRAATGDAAVYWADRLASAGYPSFRFDLPGLGDSDGDLPQTENAFLSLVNTGAFSRVVSGIIDYLVERFNLPGIVVIGHCSGATTALYSAAVNKRIKGLILLDPCFQVQPEGEIQNALVSWHFRIIRRLVGDGSAESYLRAVRLHTWIRNLYLRGKHIRLFLWRRGLPSTANLPLIRCWNQLASAGLRMLVLRSPSFTPKPGEFDYVGHLKPISDPVKLIEGTTHAFAERQGKEAVRKYVAEYLSAYVLPPERMEARDTAMRRPRPSDGY